MALRPVNELPSLGDFLKRRRNELLPTESWIHRHHQQEIGVRDDCLEGADRRGRVQRHSSLSAKLLDGLYRAMQVRAGFHVDRQVIGARIHEPLDEGFWVGHHQVDVEGQLRDFPQRFHDGWPNGEVWNKVSVHDIDVQEVSPTSLDARHLISQMSKIG